MAVFRLQRNYLFIQFPLTFTSFSVGIAYLLIEVDWLHSKTCLHAIKLVARELSFHANYVLLKDLLHLYG